MPTKSSKKRKVLRSSSKPVTEKTLEKFAQKIVTSVEGTKKVLEAKIEYFRQDSKEHATQLSQGLSKRIGRVEEELHHTQQALKATKEDLRGEIKATKEELREELKEEMSSMEDRLGDKIDSVHTRVDDHEVRITTLEGTPQ